MQKNRNTTQDELSVQSRLIDEITIFGLLSAAERQTLASSTTLREYQVGEEIIRQGEISSAINLIAYGVVVATAAYDGTDVELARLGPSDFFGESGPVAGVPSGATLTAKTSVIIYQIPQVAVSSLLKNHREIEQILSVRMAARVRDGLSLVDRSSLVPDSHSGISDLIIRCIRSLHLH
jgi:CRP-like cAMP-binding protein